MSLNSTILHHGTNYMKSDNSSEKIATDITNLALTIQSGKNQSFH